MNVLVRDVEAAIILRAMAAINTDEVSARLRVRAVRPPDRQLLIARIQDSAQEADLCEPPNCHGYGRIRHFHMRQPHPWPSNPLPILPAARRLGCPERATGNALVFQNAACNWRCWYCYVPFNLLAASVEHSTWLTAGEMVDLYLAEPDRPLIIDCSGGQPDLVPEWVPWMMDALEERGVGDSVYLWSDDNLSNDYFWHYLSPDQIRHVSTYRNYGRVCCFKGYNSSSFAFNTRADPTLFERQFDLFRRLLTLGIDLYAYATFTSPSDVDLHADMSQFVDRLQEIHPSTPLRMVPLKIETFGVVQPRVRPAHEAALAVQELAIAAWNQELRVRFTEAERSMPIVDIPFRA